MLRRDQPQYRDRKQSKVTNGYRIRGAQSVLSGMLDKPLMPALWTDDLLLVIPSINGGALLEGMLPSLQFPGANVVVLDQGSIDNTAEICERYGVILNQLGHPHTYTQACNIGAALARRRGCKYVCVSNNDIAFRTDVLGEMYAEMEQDPKLGIVAPSQVVYDPNKTDTPVAYRVYWDLSRVDFQHDTHGIGSQALRLEADFCELTCALIRMSAIDEIGFLDDTYGFYHEDADFGFRLRKAGYACAYLPRSQINHFVSSTISNDKLLRKADYIKRNKRYFVSKHLGFGINHDAAQLGLYAGWGDFQRALHPVLHCYGLLAADNPKLFAARGSPDVFSYTFIPSEDSSNNGRALAGLRQPMAVLATSKSHCDNLVQRGIRRSFHVPFGVDPDIFHPWGRPSGDAEWLTYFAMVQGQQRWVLDLLLRAWRLFLADHPAARLILHGPGLTGVLPGRPSRAIRVGNIDRLEFHDERIEVQDVTAPLHPADLATLLRSVDVAITSNQGSDEALAILQAAACGVPCIMLQTHPSDFFSVRDALVLEQLMMVQEPSAPGANGTALSALLARLHAVYSLSGADRAALSQAAVTAIRGQFTLRDTAMGLYRAFSHLQIRETAKFLVRLDGVRPVRPSAAVEALPTLAAPRGRLQYSASQRLRTVGIITAQFGADWQQKGLAAASRAATRELRYFVRRRTAQLLALAVRSRQVVAREAMRPTLAQSALLIGYIDANLGLGQSSRGLARALDLVGVDFGIYPFTVGVEGRRGDPFMPHRYDQANAHSVNVIEVTVDELDQVWRHVGRPHVEHSYNILRTYWELGKAPAAWRAKLAGIDEIWAPTQFVAESLRSVFDGEITVIPPCVDPPDAPGNGHALFELDESRFHFLFSFDYYSFPQRKNPLGVVRAFRAAFPDPGERVGLIIKSTGEPGHYPAIKHELRVAAQDDPRICIIDEALSRADMLALMAAADCYVSLHRAEGFGLGMVEAMSLGKPVIATDYSGSTDFLSEQTGYPVPYTLVPVRIGEYVHPDGQVWAEADEGACADAMRLVVDQPQDAAARVRAARAFIAGRYGPDAVGHLAKARLAAIMGVKPQPTLALSAPAEAERAGAD